MFCNMNTKQYVWALHAHVPLFCSKACACMCVNLLNSITQYYYEHFLGAKNFVQLSKIIIVKLFLMGELKISKQVILKNKVFTAAHISVEDE